MLKGKRIVSFLVSLLLAAAGWPQPAFAAAPPQISAKSAVVVNADDGTVLYAKNEHERLAIASTTKIMTALLTLEAAAKKNRTVTITPEMVRVEGSSMGLRAGDQLTLRDLAEGMLLVSGNDAANSAALCLDSSLEKFADRMNAKAAELGMKDTHFVTPSGLDSGSHYSSAGDMAILACAAMENADFSAIVRQKSMQIHFISPDKTCTFPNHNKLLSMYKGCVGIKTGYTRKAGRCLVSSAEKNGVRVIAVTLSDPDDWRDHTRLLDYGFSQLVCLNIDDSSCCISLPVVGGTRQTVKTFGTSGGSVVIRGSDSVQKTVEAPKFLYAPVRIGQVLGRVRYTCGSKALAETELIAAENVPQRQIQKNWFQNIWDGIKGLFSF